MLVPGAVGVGAYIVIGRGGELDEETVPISVELHDFRLAPERDRLALMGIEDLDELVVSAFLLSRGNDDIASQHRHESFAYAQVGGGQYDIALSLAFSFLPSFVSSERLTSSLSDDAPGAAGQKVVVDSRLVIEAVGVSDGNELDVFAG